MEGRHARCRSRARDAEDPLNKPAPEDTSFRIRRAFERSFHEGQIIFDEGHPGDYLYIIQSGEVELVRPSSRGARVLGRLGPGQFFGEMGVVLGEPRKFRAVAVTDTQVLELDAMTFQNMCVENPEIAIRVIRRLAARVIELEKRLEAVGVDDLLRPLVQILIKQAKPGREGAEIRTTLRILAEAAGMPMLDAHRGLNLLFEQKCLRLVDDVLVTPDLDQLAACLDGD